MCFYNALSWSAVRVASRYHRKLDTVDVWKEIMSEREAGKILKPRDIYKYRVAEAMYNIPAYEQPHCIIVSGSDQLQVMDWGLIPRGMTAEKKEFSIKNNRNKNARAEEIFETWPWKFLIRSRRCIIPSTGYFEYHYGSDKKARPYFIHLTDREIFSMGGLWDQWEDPRTGEKYKTFVQITTAANKFTRRIHNGGRNPFRMPLILRPEDEQKWLDPDLPDDEIARLLKPYSAHGMTARPVYQRFKDLDPYDKRIIREERDAGQGSLFSESE